MRGGKNKRPKTKKKNLIKTFGKMQHLTSGNKSCPQLHRGLEINTQCPRIPLAKNEVRTCGLVTDELSWIPQLPKVAHARTQRAHQEPGSHMDTNSELLWHFQKYYIMCGGGRYKITAIQ